ncbi:hypothetical protein HUJ05_000276 [Dendroctonus ponderosae]|nr:hypothetical protein HUJ05_000276 [Dendroctonus ponderosae]
MNFQVVLFLSVSLLFLQQSSASPVGSKLDHRSENPQSSGFIVASIINVPCKTGYVMVNGNCVKEVNGKWSPEKSSVEKIIYQHKIPDEWRTSTTVLMFKKRRQEDTIKL